MGVDYGIEGKGGGGLNSGGGVYLEGVVVGRGEEGGGFEGVERYMCYAELVG